MFSKDFFRGENERPILNKGGGADIKCKSPLQSYIQFKFLTRINLITYSSLEAMDK